MEYLLFAAVVGSILGAAWLKKRGLTRSGTDDVVAGVCSGIAHYVGWDITVVRLLWVVGTIFTGVPLLVYILLWIVLDEV